MISIAGQTLPCPDRETLDDIKRFLDPRRALPWLTRAWPGFGTVGLANPTGFRVPLSLRLNELVWPRGASRWAYGHFLAVKEDVEAIHDLAFGENGDQLNQVPLKMWADDETEQHEEDLDINVYVFAPQPIFYPPDPQGKGSLDGLYLVTVVDQRYYWWDVPCPDFGISETGGLEWTDLFSKISEALNLDPEIEVDAINEAYLQPSRAINLTYEPIPLVLDAACANVGHRLVVDYQTGNVKTQAFQTALDAKNQDDEDNPNRPILAGGDRFLEDY